MASSQTIGNPTQNKTCRCGEKDKNIWTTTSENNADKQSHGCPNCQVFKSGPLFISSKGIGWTSWKKRWFILTRTSLVFFRSDPNAPAQKGGESNLTLGGIDLNNSGSVVVRADKKLLTVLFPDGRDGRAFTLKAETSEDLQEWKIALENALAQAPSAALAMGQNGIFRNDMADSIEAAFEQWRDKQPVKSSVVGRPILLALEDIDGSPSFLEKAFRFIEQYGIKVEGILRQSADVEEVERRVHEYEQGKTEFCSDEDAHVIGDCIKHVLRELPSSPIPASCCTALVEAYRTDRGSRINAMRAAICETFPEPNLRLVQRILNMMRTVASYKNENRMSPSALAACMAPLLLRPLLAGDCEFEDNFSMGGDGSIQLLQAAAAANHAQAIVIILLEDYEKIFKGDSLQDGSSASDLYSESEDGDIDDEESTDDDILEDDGYQDEQNDTEAEIEDGHECTSSGTLDESSSELESDLSGNEDVEDDKANSVALVDNAASKVCQTVSDRTTVTLLQQDTNQESSPHSISQHDAHINDIFQREDSKSLAIVSQGSNEASEHVATSTSTVLKSVDHTLPSNVAKSAEKSNEPVSSSKRPTVWGRTSARKNLSMESIDYSSDDEIAIKKLEMTKSDLQTKITKEVKGNAILQESLEKRKEALHERRLALEQDVERLREQLQREKDLRASLESGLMNLRPGQLSPITPSMNSKARADLEEIALAEADVISLKHKVADLRVQLGHQMQHNYASLCEACSRPLSTREPLPKNSQKKYVAGGSSLYQNDAQSTSEDGLSGETSAVQAQMINLHSLSNQDSSQKEQPESTSCSSAKSSGFNRTSSTPSSTPWTSLSEKTQSPRDENAFIQAQHEDLEARIEDSSPSPNGDPLCKLQGKTSNQNDKAHLGVSSSAHSEEQNTAVSKTTSKKTISRIENCLIGADSENIKNQAQNTPSSPEKQPPHKQETNKTSSSKSLRSNSNSSIEEPGSSHRNSASKKSSSSGENVKKDNEDSACSTNRHSSQKQQANTGKSTSERSLGCNNSSSSEEPLAAGRTPTSRRSSTREDAAVSSSALTRLTNRLNFLKERRVQLVNELQNLDNNRISAPERPCPSENTR